MIVLGHNIVLPLFIKCNSEKVSSYLIVQVAQQNTQTNLHLPVSLKI